MFRLFAVSLIAHSQLPSPTAPTASELTHKAARFFSENLFAERFGGLTQLSAFSVQTANEAFNCFGATKLLRRFPQKAFQDSDIVITTDLVLQLGKPRSHLVHSLGPNRLQKLELVKKSFHPDAPFVKGFVSPILKRSIHPFTALAVNVLQSWLNDLPFAVDKLQLLKIVSRLFQIFPDLV